MERTNEIAYPILYVFLPSRTTEPDVDRGRKVVGLEDWRTGRGSLLNRLLVSRPPITRGAELKVVAVVCGGSCFSCCCGGGGCCFFKKSTTHTKQKIKAEKYYC